MIFFEQYEYLRLIIIVNLNQNYVPVQSRILSLARNLRVTAVLVKHSSDRNGGSASTRSKLEPSEGNLLRR